MINFDIDAELDTKIKVREIQLKDVKKIEFDLQSEENKEWKKFVQVAMELYKKIIDYNYININYNHYAIIYVLDYDQNKYLVCKDTTNIYIYSEQQSIIKRRKIVGELVYNCICSIHGNLWDIESNAIALYVSDVDYSKLDIIKMLYNNMKLVYADMLEKETYDTEQKLAFRKLVSF